MSQKDNEAIKWVKIRLKEPKRVNLVQNLAQKMKKMTRNGQK